MIIMQKLVNSKYVQMNLGEVIKQRGEDGAKCILSDFTCDKNKDVEDFIRNKAIIFSNQGLAKTHLIFWSSSDARWGGKAIELIGYYAIALKTIVIKKNTVSNAKWKKICKFGDCISNPGECKMAALLIGQLSKNFNDGNDTLLSGSELMELVLEKVKKIQADAGSRIVYLECEDKPKLLQYYESNGFQVFGKRELDGDETNLRGKYLIQLFRYL